MIRALGLATGVLPQGFVDQDYLGVEKTYYVPTERGFEAEISRRIIGLRGKSSAEMGVNPDDKPGDEDEHDL